MSYIRNCKRDYSKEMWLCQGKFQVFLLFAPAG